VLATTSSEIQTLVSRVKRHHITRRALSTSPCPAPNPRVLNYMASYDAKSTVHKSAGWARVDSARHVVERILNPRFLSHVASDDVARHYPRVPQQREGELARGFQSSTTFWLNLTPFLWDTLGGVNLSVTEAAQVELKSGDARVPADSGKEGGLGGGVSGAPPRGIASHIVAVTWSGVRRTKRRLT